MFLRFNRTISERELPSVLNNPFDYSPHPLCDEAHKLLLDRIGEWQSDTGDDVRRRFCSELAEGKMLGVLVVLSPDGEPGWLAAFSGQICDGFCHEGFVGPVFDYLDENGHFKVTEREISSLNAEIREIEERELALLRDDYDSLRCRYDKRIADMKAAYKAAKAARSAMRASSGCTDETRAALIRESQWQKAEIHRMKLEAADRLKPCADRLQECGCRIKSLKKKRACMSDSLQHWLFDSFIMLNGNGEARSLTDIFSATPFGVPPSGSGECCAPKLLQYAFVHDFKPLAIAEYWYGRSPDGEVRHHGAHYPACRGKCLPILTWMLQGCGSDFTGEASGMCAHSFGEADMEIEFENEWFCVVHKPAGLLSVPGKGRDISLLDLLRQRYGTEKDVRLAHRLDQQTSGLMLAAFGEEPYKLLQKMFATRKIHKTYVAVLDGDIMAKGLPRRGRIELPLGADILDRPRQRVDSDNGKEAVTEYEVADVSRGLTRILFRPLTGRTHQLRVHSASLAGLGTPIVGDNLYKKADATPSPRMLLHAESLEFTFPIDGKSYSFRHPADF